MQVGVLQFLELQAGGTCAATILFRPMGTVDVLGIRQRQLQFADTRYTREELCVGDTPLPHGLPELLLRFFLPYDVSEKQFSMYDLFF